MKKLLVLVLLLFNSCFINREEDRFIDSIYRGDWVYFDTFRSINFNRNGDFDVIFAPRDNSGRPVLSAQDLRMEFVEAINDEQAYYRFYYRIGWEEVGPLYIGVSHGWTDDFYSERVLFFTYLYRVPSISSDPSNREKEYWLKNAYRRDNLDFRRGNAFAKKRGYRASSEDAKKAVFIKPS